MKTIVFIRFTENKIFAEKIIQNYSLEEVCKWHNNSLLNKRLPFGGVGHSGIGAYHGALVLILFT
jgi:aldehyde dehydrogenase (NAD+)